MKVSDAFSLARLLKKSKSEKIDPFNHIINIKTKAKSNFLKVHCYTTQMFSLNPTF